MILELPREIQVKIFGYLDFKSLQHNATRVCKTWFEIIRNDSNLSGKLTLSLKSGSDINSVLASWKRLKTLCFKNLYRKTDLTPELMDSYHSYQNHTNTGPWTPNDLRDVDLNLCKSLEKVYVLHDFPGK